MIAFGNVHNTITLDLGVFDDGAPKGWSAGFDCDDGFDKLWSSVAPQPAMGASLRMDN